MAALLQERWNESLLERMENATATEVLAWAVHTFGDSIAICTSFQRAGMVIVNMAAQIAARVRVFTLDTGRLPEESYQMIEKIRKRYGISVELVLPDAAEVESMVSRHGPNLFYDDVSQRLLCCHIRKARPLERKLRELSAYVVGLRRSQTAERAAIRKVHAGSTPVKISPLADWTSEQVEEYTRKHDVPVHPLYAKGYTSIGCAPCTRAVVPGEPERAGRWWWEQDTPKECGIHFGVGAQAERKVDVLLSQVLAPKDAAGPGRGRQRFFSVTPSPPPSM